AVVLSAPACSSDDESPATTSSTLSGCELDCATIPAPPCQVGQCNLQTGQCELVALDSTPCDDGLFCTVGDTCHAGVCTGDPNRCGVTAPGCKVVACDEPSRTCHLDDDDDGALCTPGEVCSESGTCQKGHCVGITKACVFAAAPDE